MKIINFSFLLVLLLLTGSCMENHLANEKTSGLQKIPRQKSGILKTPPTHVVIVIEENHSESQIIGNPEAPYMNWLAKNSAFFTHSYAIEHPSQPNYLDLFSGSNQGVQNDSCPHTFSSPNLASELIANHLSFRGYSEDLPSVGSKVCTNKAYARKHSPWVNFTNVPSDASLPFSHFPKNYSHLPTVSFVIPNLDHDMHNGTVKSADNWLKSNIGPYVKWMKDHNSLLILTWDENDGSSGNRILTLFKGPMVQNGKYAEPINHFTVLRTIESLYDLPFLGKSADVHPITSIWK
ncbi:MAG TPA: alkaline phosphatase family protein [Bacillales bacterium]|nr:alkaline phosphatase family protein [Bacillales bacterium]